MPFVWRRYYTWQERFGARPGETREHAEMRSGRSHRKHLRRVRRREAAGAAVRS